MWKNFYIDDFASMFEDERDYIDNAFCMIILFNFGIWLDRSKLRAD